MRVADAGRAEDQDVVRLREESARSPARGPRADELVRVLGTTSGVAPDAAAIDRGYERASLDRNPESFWFERVTWADWPPRIRLARRHRVTTRPIPIDSSISTKP
jgi:hypothetical protein